MNSKRQVSSVPDRSTRRDSFLRSDSVESAIENYDVVIIGAGLSGLTAAHTLLSKESSLRVVVLESQGRVGGRIRSTPMIVNDGKKDFHFATGGDAFSDHQTQLKHLLGELELTPLMIHSKGAKICHTKGGVARRYSSELPKLGNILADLDLKNFIGKIDKMSKKLASHLYLDAMNLETFLNQEMSTNAAIRAVKMVIRNTLGLEARLVSAFYFLVFVNGVSSVYNLFDNRHFEIKEGVSSLIDTLEHRTNCTKLFEKVMTVEQAANKVLVTTQSTLVCRCDCVIIAIPPAEVLKIDFTPVLPATRVALLRQFIPGHLTKFVATYKDTFWRTNGDTGEVAGDGGDSHTTVCDSGPVHVMFDATSSLGHPALAGILGGLPSIQWSRVSAAERKSRRLAQLVKFWGTTASKPLDYAEVIWPAGGGGITPGVMEWYSQVDAQHGSVYFAGTEVSNRWPGYMNGAVHSAMKASMDVLMAIRPQTIEARDVKIIERRSRATDPYAGVALAFGLAKKGLIELKGSTWKLLCPGLPTLLPGVVGVAIRRPFIPSEETAREKRDYLEETFQVNLVFAATEPVGQTFGSSNGHRLNLTTRWSEPEHSERERHEDLVLRRDF